MRLALVALAIGMAMTAGAEQPKDPSKDGPSQVGWRKALVPDDTPGATLEALIYYPAAEEKEDVDPSGSGPWPVCVFSPGGPATSCQGYDDFGKRFSSWGIVMVVVGFRDRPADKRALQFTVVRDWLEKQNAAKDWFLKGKLDTKLILAAGHSRGGAAAMLAAADAKKWAGCVVDGPALREVPPKYATPTFIIGCAEDKTLPALYDGQKKPRWLVVVAGMDHFMTPPEKRAIVVSYCAAWIGWRVLKIADFKTWVAGDRGKKDLKDGVLADWRSEE